MGKVKIATMWLDGCSGCHMSFLDMDERLLALAEQVEIVYSPIVDTKVFPEGVDVTIVEGAVSSVDDLERVHAARSRSKILVALGDCAVTSNVSGMRNPIGNEPAFQRAYHENATIHPGTPTDHVPALLPKVVPLHEVVKVDFFVPGCPPSADTIHYVVSELLAGRTPAVSEKTRFGA